MNCTNIAGGAAKLAVGASATWTCEHTLTATGEYTNVAVVEGNEEPKESNEVVVEVPAAPNFTIEKLQEIAGSGGGFTKNELTGKVGQVVDYRIIVDQHRKYGVEPHELHGRQLHEQCGRRERTGRGWDDGVHVSNTVATESRGGNITALRLTASPPAAPR